MLARNSSGKTKLELVTEYCKERQHTSNTVSYQIEREEKRKKRKRKGTLKNIQSQRKRNCSKCRYDAEKLRPQKQWFKPIGPLQENHPPPLDQVASRATCLVLEQVDILPNAYSPKRRFLEKYAWSVDDVEVVSKAVSTRCLLIRDE